MQKKENAHFLCERGLLWEEPAKAGSWPASTSSTGAGKGSTTHSHSGCCKASGSTHQGRPHAGAVLILQRTWLRTVSETLTFPLWRRPGSLMLTPSSWSPMWTPKWIQPGLCSLPLTTRQSSTRNLRGSFRANDAAFKKLIISRMNKACPTSSSKSSGKEEWTFQKLWRLDLKGRHISDQCRCEAQDFQG